MAELAAIKQQTKALEAEIDALRDKVRELQYQVETLQTRVITLEGTVKTAQENMPSKVEFDLIKKMIYAACALIGTSVGTALINSILKKL